MKQVPVKTGPYQSKSGNPWAC